MKVQLVILSLILSIIQTLAPVQESHGRTYYSYEKGCYEGRCWAYCGWVSWCYTKDCVDCDGEYIACTGDEYDDDDCPYYEDDEEGNCKSKCFII